MSTPEEPIGMSESDWFIAEAVALRDEATDTEDPERFVALRNEAVATGQQAVRARFIESLKEAHPTVDFPPFEDGESMLEYMQRTKTFIDKEE